MHSDKTKANSEKVIREKKPYMRALIFLIVVVILTVMAAVFNNMLENDVAELNQNIDTTQQKIDDMNASSNLLQASALLEKNRATLKKLESRSKVVSYINHIADISLKYGVSMSGFEYSGDSIASVLLSTTKNQNDLAYKNIVGFLAEYNKDEKRLFDIGYISNITGHDNIKFPLEFKIK